MPIAAMVVGRARGDWATIWDTYDTARSIWATLDYSRWSGRSRRKAYAVTGLACYLVAGAGGVWRLPVASAAARFLP